MKNRRPGLDLKTERGRVMRAHTSPGRQERVILPTKTSLAQLLELRLNLLRSVVAGSS